MHPSAHVFEQVCSLSPVKECSRKALIAILSVTCAVNYRRARRPRLSILHDVGISTSNVHTLQKARGESSRCNSVYRRVGVASVSLEREGGKLGV